jgi:HSP20 family protein
LGLAEFGFPALVMPPLPFDWLGMLKLALDIQETGKQHRISLDGPGVEEKDIQITPDNDVPMVRGESARSKRRAKWLFSCRTSLRQFPVCTEPARRCQPGFEARSKCTEARPFDSD